MERVMGWIIFIAIFFVFPSFAVQSTGFWDNVFGWALYAIGIIALAIRIWTFPWKERWRMFWRQMERDRDLARAARDYNKAFGRIFTRDFSDKDARALGRGRKLYANGKLGRRPGSMGFHVMRW